jgi:hypothetical protein
MSVAGLSQRGTAGSYDVDLEEMLNDTSLPFSYLLEHDKQGNIRTDVYYQDFLNENQIRGYRRSRKENKEIVPINEASRRELLDGADYARKQRAKKLHTRYMGVSQHRGWITFQTNSQYTPGIKYTQYVKINDAKDMKYFKEFNKRDIIRLFLSGDLSVHCTCPDYKFRGFKYMGYQMGYGIFKEMRYPKIRNPHLEGTVCKHLICVLGVLTTNWMSIAKDMQKTKFFKRKYEDEEYMKELEDSKKAKGSGSKKMKSSGKRARS